MNIHHLPAAVPGAAQRRRDVRHLTLQRCLVWPGQPGEPDGWRCIAYNISTQGIGLTLPLPLPVGSPLTVRPWDLPGAEEVQARVIHARPVQWLWFCGCELVRPLTEAELSAWLNVSTGWLRAEPPGPLGW